MARRSYRRTRRTNRRSFGGRRRSRSFRSRTLSRRGRPRAQTVRVVIQQAPSLAPLSAVMATDQGLTTAAGNPRKARF